MFIYNWFHYLWSKEQNISHATYSGVYFSKWYKLQTTLRMQLGDLSHSAVNIIQYIQQKISGYDNKIRQFSSWSSKFVLKTKKDTRKNPSSVNNVFAILNLIGLISVNE